MSAAIDFNHLELYVSGDDTLRNEILTIFTEQANRWIGELDAYLPDEDWRNAAHALKGASRGVGAWTVGDLCESAESLTGAGADKLALRQMLLSELSAEVANAVAAARHRRDGGA